MGYYHETIHSEWHEWHEHSEHFDYLKHLDTFPNNGIFTGSAYLCSLFENPRVTAHSTGYDLYTDDDTNYFTLFISNIVVKYNGEKSIPLKVMDDLVVYSGDESGEE